MTPWTVAGQAPLSIEFSRQEYFSGLPFPSLGDLLTQELNPGLLHCRQILYHLRHQGSPWRRRDEQSTVGIKQRSILKGKVWGNGSQQQGGLPYLRKLDKLPQVSENQRWTAVSLVNEENGGKGKRAGVETVGELRGEWEKRWKQNLKDRRWEREHGGLRSCRKGTARGETLQQVMILRRGKQLPQGYVLLVILNPGVYGDALMGLSQGVVWSCLILESAL